MSETKMETASQALGAETEGSLRTLLERTLTPERTDGLMRLLVIPHALLTEDQPTPEVPETERRASRAVVAEALNVLLFQDLLDRVPAAQRYAERAVAQGRTITHDHGAVRTVALAGMGALPAGEEAITRILRPLGYERRGVYPLERLNMTGRSYAQAEYPEQIAQFFISELHPERFSPEFQEAVQRVTSTSVDPLTPEAQRTLAKLEAEGSLGLDEAAALLPVLLGCFARQHADVSAADYEGLLKESAEMAWIATEGNSFNHVTDRVGDVAALAEEQRALGEPIKEKLEHSASGRVTQTALLAARVMRAFVAPDGSEVLREVPGSFLEFITRLPQEDGTLDLGFDSSNAQGIFKMTAGPGA
jgi:hypothetical protein